MAEKTNIINTIKIPNSSFYYKDDYSKNWVDDNIYVYALDICLEEYLGGLLKFSLDRIIYTQNSYTFYERERKNDGLLNLPYMNYYRVGYSEADRSWFNQWANQLYPLSHNEQIYTLGQKIKIFPIKIEYEATAFFSQSKDLEHAYRNMLFEASNESIIYPTLETKNKDTVKNIGIVDFDLEYEPNFEQEDWLEKNKIHSIGMNFSVDTFMFVGDLSEMSIAEEVILKFLSAKELNYEDIDKSKGIELLIEYFGEQN